MSTKAKKIAILALMVLIIAGVFFSSLTTTDAIVAPVGPQKQTGPIFGTAVPNASANTGDFCVASPMCWFKKIITYLVWTPASWFMSLGGMTMNLGIDLSIKSDTFRSLATGPGAVATGWGVARDIVNLFLIFILLYIAIATILQLSGYEAKQLLLTLIIIAFLVNFSLVITRLIIDASNVLAMAFYDKVAPNGNISDIFKTAFDVDKYVNAKKSIETYGGNTDLNILMALFLSAVVMVIAGFIFLVFGILFILRMVVLLILMIFAPLAFAAHVLPSTKSHARSWWHSLFSQAFFAPAALFMLYISAWIANSPFIRNAVKIDQLGLLDAITDTSTKAAGWQSTYKLILEFIIVAILLCASLVVAKQMGAMGANTAIAIGKKAKGKVQGYAGRIAARTAVARPARRLAESELGKKIGRIPLVGGAMYRTMEKAAKAGKLEEVTAKKAETKAKLGQTLSTKELETYIPKLDPRSMEALFNKLPERQRGALLEANPHIFDKMFDRLESTLGKEAITEMIAKLGNNIPTVTGRKSFFDAQSPELQTRMFQLTSARERVELLKGLTTPDQDRLKNTLSLEEKEKTEKSGKELERKGFADKIEELRTVLADFTTGLKAIRPDEWKDIDETKMVAALKDTTAITPYTSSGSSMKTITTLGEAKKEEMINNMSSAHLGKIIDRGDAVSKLFIDELYNLGMAAGGNIDGLVAELQLRGNFSLAGKINDPTVKSQLVARGLKA